MELGRGRGEIQDALVGTGREGLKDTMPRGTALEAMDLGRGILFFKADFIYLFIDYFLDCF